MFLLIIAVLALFLIIGISYVKGEKAGNKAQANYEKLYQQLISRSDDLSIKEKELQNQENNLKKYESDLNNKQKDIQASYKELDKRTAENESIKKLLLSKVSDIPFLAKIYADLYGSQVDLLIHHLCTKKRPAFTAAETLREMKNDIMFTKEKMKIFQYRCSLYETVVPFLAELEEDKIEDLANAVIINSPKEPTDDNARLWLTPDEYASLPDVQKYQLALDRWWSRKKTRVELGADYERYIGYLFELDNWYVKYNGIHKGLNDMGIDLICQKGTTYLTVQCKYWSSKKTIHEKHINQLFGTTVDFYLDTINPKGNFSDFYNKLHNKEIIPLFVTSTNLSETAKRVCSTLGVQFREEQKFQPYPIIKCNINPTTKERIYHLPFDQQYDRTKVDKAGEFYALTVAEAEEAGFRRAKRHFYN